MEREAAPDISMKNCIPGKSHAIISGTTITEETGH
jgi:hypothetical protein